VVPFDLDVLVELLRHIYTGNFQSSLPQTTLVKLLSAADHLEIESLSAQCLEDFSKIAPSAELFYDLEFDLSLGSFPHYHGKVIELLGKSITADPGAIIKDTRFPDIPAYLLVRILAHSNFVGYDIVGMWNSHGKHSLTDVSQVSNACPHVTTETRIVDFSNTDKIRINISIHESVEFGFYPNNIFHIRRDEFHDGIYILSFVQSGGDRDVIEDAHILERGGSKAGQVVFFCHLILADDDGREYMVISVYDDEEILQCVPLVGIEEKVFQISQNSNVISW